MSYAARRLYQAVRRRLLLAWDNVSTIVLDALDRAQPHPEPILRIEDGIDPKPGSRCVAIFVTFSTDGELTAMVRRQLESYNELGFAIILVSNSPFFPDALWQVARDLAELVVHRRNSGLDFGAWRDLFPTACQRWPDADEVLLVNDSVICPIRPLQSVLDAMHAKCPGFYGLVESLQSGVHLQSWFNLARGRAVIDDLGRFLGPIELSPSKRKVIRHGKLAIACIMMTAGHTVAAIYGYKTTVGLAVSTPDQHCYLEKALPLWFAGADDKVVWRRFLMQPVSPMH